MFFFKWFNFLVLVVSDVFFVFFEVVLGSFVVVINYKVLVVSKDWKVFRVCYKNVVELEYCWNFWKEKNKFIFYF